GPRPRLHPDLDPLRVAARLHLAAEVAERAQDGDDLAVEARQQRRHLGRLEAVPVLPATDEGLLADLRGDLRRSVDLEGVVRLPAGRRPAAVAVAVAPAAVAAACAAVAYVAVVAVAAVARNRDIALAGQCGSGAGHRRE